VADEPAPGTASVPDIQARLHAVAQLLQESPSLDPASQRALAELVDELSKAIRADQVPPAELAHLAENTARLAESLHHHDQGLLARMRDGFEKAAVNAEVYAPRLTGLAQRLLDALANLGI
jgi:hypothetical protein